MLARSFAQFQADRPRVRLRHRRADRAAADLASWRRAGTAGPRSSTSSRLRRAASSGSAATRRCTARAAATRCSESLSALRPGDVIDSPHRTGPRLLAVLSVAHRKGGSVKVAHRHGPGDARCASTSPTPAGRWTRWPPSTCRCRSCPRTRRTAREAAARLRRVNHPPGQAQGAAPSASPSRTALARRRARPCESTRSTTIADAGAAGAQRPTGPPARQEVADVDRQVERRGSGVRAPLRRRAGRAARTTATWRAGRSPRPGERLRRIYHECDLLVSLASPTACSTASTRRRWPPW